MTDIEKLELALYRIRGAANPPRDPMQLVEAIIYELSRLRSAPDGQNERDLTGFAKETVTH